MKKVLQSKALLAFVMGTVLFLLVMLPEMIGNNGLLIIDGDNRTQGIPFTYHIRDAVLSGNVIWDHSSGLGGQFLSNYAYYNLFSPFSLLYLLIPRSAIIYALPYVTALKFGVGSMLAYLYLRRFLKEPHFAVIGGLLYMFSSFSAYNLVFHFADIIALFPLLLIAMEELCTARRRGGFVLACCLMAYVNYYFFFGQAVFLVIYFLVRCTDRKSGYGIRTFLYAGAEAVMGVLLAAPMLVPVAVSLMQSTKATTTMAASDMLLYENIFYYLKLIQSACMVPDTFQAVSLFPAADNHYPFGMLWASVAAYIPLFSVAGVVSYVFARRKSWESILIAVCVVMAFVPLLNQSFSAFNSNFYARWYYMPMLIACLVSLRALEERISFRPGIILCSVAVSAMMIYHLIVDVEELIPKHTSRAMINVPLNWIYFAITIIGIICLILICKAPRDKEFIPKTYILAMANIYIVFGIMSFSLLSYIEDMDGYIALYCFDERPTMSDSTDRMAASGDTSNFNLIWQKNGSPYFNSTRDPGFQRFLDDNELKTNVGIYLNIEKNRPVLAGAIAVREFYVIDTWGFEDYKVTGSYGPYTIIENPYYFPMGCSYDEMISYEDFLGLDTEDRHKVYTKYLVADDPQQFGDILALSDVTVPDDDELLRQAALRRETAAESVVQTADGIVARTNNENEELLFFPISYNTAWSAYIDGTQATVYEVNNGLIGVRMPAGSHELTLRYTVRGFAEGVAAAAVGIAAYIIYLLLMKKTEKQ